MVPTSMVQEAESMSRWGQHTGWVENCNMVFS